MSVVFSGYPTNGTLLYSVVCSNSDAPIGSAWVKLTTNHAGEGMCDIVDLFTPKRFQRMGVASLLINTLLNSYDIITTGTFTVDGKCIQKKFPWKVSAEKDRWYLRKSLAPVAKTPRKKK